MNKLSRLFLSIALALCVLATGGAQTQPSNNTQAQPVTMSNSTVLAGQQTATSSSVALATNTIKTVCVKALAGNANTVYLGPSGVTSSTGMELTAGNTWCGNVTNTNLLFIVAPTGSPAVSWIATN